MTDKLPEDPVDRAKAVIASQARYHVDDVLNEVKFSRPGWVQQLIHTWQHEIRAQRIIRGEDDRFVVGGEDE